ncbi:phosphatidylinositol-3,5-bisphosphate 3-phosphatase MTMR3-like isoform X1 [Lampetra fluviatilis]
MQTMSQEENKMDGVDNNTAAPKESPVEQSAGGEEECLKVRFAVLSGEHVQHVQRAADSVLTLTNYRLHIVRGRHSTNIPLRLIDSVESRDMFQLQITCKDGRVYMCSLQTFEECQSLCKRLSNMALLPPGLDGLFAFAHHATCQDGGSGDGQATLCQPGEHIVERFQNEVERMGYDLENAWRTSEVNTSYRLCASYPQQLLVPAWITDKELERVASFRSGKRIPVVVYRHQHNGAVIARSSQPEVSWWGWRSPEDEHLIQSMARACALNKWEPGGGGTGSNGYGAEFSSLQSEYETSQVPAAQSLLIMDARSYPAAVANRAKGGGCECPEYYPNCEITFMSMANIHYIRKSFQSLRTLCSQPPDPNSWLSALENTRWLQHLSLLLKAGCAVAGAVAGEGRPVLVHCSDGWDRTPQIVALAKLLLDPYYRTIQGFQVLVEMEWLDFGHKFADRCGHGDGSEDASERCPVFLQWLDCVHQLQRQFPCSFEFNEAFLVKLVQHTYSCLYGTFLCNSTRERAERSIANRCCSVWLLLRPANKAFTNLLYTPGSDTVLRPVYHVRSLLLWSGVYLPEPFSAGPPPRDLPPAPPPTFPLPNPKAEEGPHPRLSKTRSFEDLPSATEGVAQAGGPGGGRRLSDPSLQGLGLRIDRRGSMEIISCVSDTPTEDGLLAQSETFTCAPSRDSGLEASDPDCAPICSGHEVDHHRRERTAASDMHDHKPLVNKVGFELDVVAKADSSLGNTCWCDSGVSLQPAMGHNMHGKVRKQASQCVQSLNRINVPHELLGEFSAEQASEKLDSAQTVIHSASSPAVITWSSETCDAGTSHPPDKNGDDDLAWVDADMVNSTVNYRKEKNHSGMSNGHCENVNGNSDSVSAENSPVQPSASQAVEQGMVQERKSVMESSTETITDEVQTEQELSSDNICGQNRQGVVITRDIRSAQVCCLMHKLKSVDLDAKENVRSCKGVKSNGLRSVERRKACLALGTAGSMSKSCINGEHKQKRGRRRNNCGACKGKFALDRAHRATEQPRRCRAGKQCTNCSLTETQGLEQSKQGIEKDIGTTVAVDMVPLSCGRHLADLKRNHVRSKPNDCSGMYPQASSSVGSGLTQCSNRQNQGYADSGWPLTNGDAEQEKCTASIDMKNTNCESTIPINSGHHQCTHHKIGSRCVSVNSSIGNDWIQLADYVPHMGTDRRHSNGVCHPSACSSINSASENFVHCGCSARQGGALEKNAAHPVQYCDNVTRWSRASSTMAAMTTVVASTTATESWPGEEKQEAEGDEEGEGDPDGLPCAPDPVQRRLLQMDAQHRRETLLLRRALQELRAQLSGRQRQQHLQAERPKLDMSGGPNRRQPECPEELSTISDLDSEVESGPLSQCSTGMVSETSWEHIDTQDGHQMAKLVPSQCYSCEGPVWLQSTEHYCRDEDLSAQSWSCGKVFCASCCDGRMSPPSKKPLDVCGTCRDGVRKDGARVNEFETPQTAASSS